MVRSARWSTFARCFPATSRWFHVKQHNKHMCHIVTPKRSFSQGLLIDACVHLWAWTRTSITFQICLSLVYNAALFICFMNAVCASIVMRRAVAQLNKRPSPAAYCMGSKKAMYDMRAECSTLCRGARYVEAKRRDLWMLRCSLKGT